MEFRTRLLAAAAAIALPAALAGAQTAAPTAPAPPLGGALNPGTQANVPVEPTVTPPVADTASPTTLQTEEAIEATADAVEAEATADAQAQAPLPAATAPAPAAQPAQTQVAAQAGPVTLATAADLRAGVPVRDQSGALVGTVESADAAGAVVTTGTARARLPLASFGRSNQGLVIAMSKGQLEAAVAAAVNTPS